MTSNSALAAALVEFQSQVPTIPKNRKASIPTRSGGSYSYSYADLTDIWDSIRPVLTKCGMAVTQMLCSVAGGQEVAIGITTTVWHKSGETISSTIHIPTGGKTPQEVGSVITYYKRYALAAALGISTDEDDDGAAGSAKPAVKKPSRLDVVKGELRAAIKEAGLSREQASEYSWVAKATDADYDRIAGLVELLKMGKAV